MTDRRPKRPANVVGNAVRVMQIAPGEREEEFEPELVKHPKNAAAVEMGKLGGRKRAESMTPERRAEIARKAAEKRWSQAPSTKGKDKVSPRRGGA